MDPMARARALDAAGKLDVQTAPIMSQIAMRQSLLSPQAGRIPPEQVVRMVVPEAQQKDAYKELQESQQMNKARDNILESFDRLTKINTVGNRLASPIQSARQVAAIKDPLVAQLSKETAADSLNRTLSF